MLILTDHAWLNLAPFSTFLFFSLCFTAAAGAAPQAPSPTGRLLPPCTSPTTRLLPRRLQRPPPSPCPWRLTRTPPTTPPTASPLPCSPRRTHITPICSLLQRPCLHHHRLRLAPCQYPDILLLGVPTQVNITSCSQTPHIALQWRGRGLHVQPTKNKKQTLILASCCIRLPRQSRHMRSTRGIMSEQRLILKHLRCRDRWRENVTLVII